MEITRNEHARYMSRLTPILIALYLIQAWLYQKFAPAHLSGDVNLFLGVGLAIIILLYHFYDLHHKIIMRPNFIETRFDILKMKEEILYRKVTMVEVKKSRWAFGKVILHTFDGETFELHHLDAPEEVAQYIENKRKMAA